MKRALTIIAAFAALTLSAQNKLDSDLRQFVEEATATDSIVALVEFAADDHNFGTVDVDIMSRVGPIAIVRVGADQVRAIAQLPNVVGISASKTATPLAEKKTLTDKTVPVTTKRYVWPASPGIFGGLKR